MSATASFSRVKARRSWSRVWVKRAWMGASSWLSSPGSTDSRKSFSETWLTASDNLRIGDSPRPTMNRPPNARATKSPPAVLDHPEPARFLITGTGITHTGSADARNKMHVATNGSGAPESDSMKMFRMGIAGGKPAAGQIGIQPEWFFKGNAQCVVPPGAPLPLPAFALAGAEEPEIVGLYIVDDNGLPHRIGYALGNEFSDHVTEAQNYLYAAHSKLRACSMGPELLVGDLPPDVRGETRILRDGAVAWQEDFLSGEANMSHSVANLEHHHFKYEMFRRPGDLHAYFFGAAVLSFAAGFRTRDGDVFELEAPVFGKPLRNRMEREKDLGLITVNQL